MQPPEPTIGSTITAARSASCSWIRRGGAGEVVVGRDDEGERHIPGRPAGREEEHAAVVAAVEDQDLRPAGLHPRGRDREQGRLGARVREPHAVEPEPLAHQLRELPLVRVDPAHACELAHRGVDGVEHPPLAVPEEAGV